MPNHTSYHRILAHAAYEEEIERLNVSTTVSTRHSRLAFVNIVILSVLCFPCSLINPISTPTGHLYPLCDFLGCSPD